MRRAACSQGILPSFGEAGLSFAVWEVSNTAVIMLGVERTATRPSRKIDSKVGITIDDMIVPTGYASSCLVRAQAASNRRLKT